PGAPLRNGSIVSFSSSPGLSVLLDQPSRTNALGAAPSRLQSWVPPSCCLTARMMNECGLVNLNSCTTPSSSIGFSWSNIANGEGARPAPPPGRKPNRPPAVTCGGMAPPFLIAPCRAGRSRGTRRTHAMRMSPREPEESPGHKDAMPADGTFLAALATNGDTGTSPFHGSSWSVEPSDIILYQERGASERSSWLVGVPILVRVTATGHLMGVGGSHIRDFYYPGPLCLRSIARHFAAPRQSAATIDQT